MTKFNIMQPKTYFKTTGQGYLLKKWIMTIINAKLNKLALVWNRTDAKKQIYSIKH